LFKRVIRLGYLFVFLFQASNRGMDRRVVAQLFDCIDSLSCYEEQNDSTITTDDDGSVVGKRKNKNVILIAATNKYVMTRYPYRHF
jgi:hypothetical protein